MTLIIKNVPNYIGTYSIKTLCRKHGEKVKKLVSKVWKKREVAVLEADKGYDSKRVRMEVLRHKMIPFIPYRQGSKAKQGICYLEKFRWKVERTIAWIKTKYRRISTRWERKVKYWKGFFYFALIELWLKFIEFWIKLFFII